MTLAEKLNKVYENVDKVYEAGKSQGGDFTEWWTDFVSACETAGTWEQSLGGAGMTDKTFNPPIDIIPTVSANSMFYKSGIEDLKGVIDALGISFDLSKATSANSTFSNAKVTRLPKIDLRNSSNVSNTFNNCKNLVSIDEFSVSRAVTNSFTACTSLKEIRIGDYLVASFNISDCVSLSAESIDDIINHLGGTATSTLTLPSVAPTTYDAVYGAGSFEARVNARPSNWTIAY